MEPRSLARLCLHHDDSLQPLTTIHASPVLTCLGHVSKPSSLPFACGRPQEVPAKVHEHEVVGSRDFLHDNVQGCNDPFGPQTPAQTPATNMGTLYLPLQQQHDALHIVACYDDLSPYLPTTVVFVGSRALQRIHMTSPQLSPSLQM
ncbi:hypothetical protein C0995_001136 [Termitomyces sp. Mi166|nr:hypothetical protein C0995_001136 [Termitomyces sp. Mi166\